MVNKKRKQTVWDENKNAHLIARGIYKCECRNNKKEDFYVDRENGEVVCKKCGLVTARIPSIVGEPIDAWL